MQDNLSIMKQCGAFLEGHFLLSSGLHSGGYCQCAKLLRFPDLAAKVLKTVADRVRELNLTKVCGPAMGGVVVSYELARQLGVESIFTERENGEMRLRRGFSVGPGIACSSRRTSSRPASPPWKPCARSRSREPRS